MNNNYYVLNFKSMYDLIYKHVKSYRYTDSSPLGCNLPNNFFHKIDLHAYAFILTEIK